MNKKILVLSIILGIISISSTSIGIQFYNKCDEKLGKEKAMKNNKIYLIILLISSIAVTLVGLVLAARDGRESYRQYRNNNYQYPNYNYNM